MCLSKVWEKRLSWLSPIPNGNVNADFFSDGYPVLKAEIVEALHMVEKNIRFTSSADDNE